MASATVRIPATKVIVEKTEERREKRSGFFSRVGNLLEAYGEKRLRYLEEEHGGGWWTNCGYI